jgi:acyl-coenzyme A thioesterase PaaI-like protein
MARLPHSHPGVCYVCEASDGHRIVSTFVWDDELREVQVRAHLGPGCQGAPGFAHGGSLFALLDEAMGMAAWRSGHKVLTAHASIDYRRPVRLCVDLDIRASVVRVEGRKVWTRAELLLGDSLMAQAEGLFIATEGHVWDLPGA